jgi:HD-GYP domain-containing protein (c-di-GMP phosphodiesterase class II)
LKLVWELLYRDYNLYNHSLNVCLLGMAMMLFLKKTRAESQLMGLVGLFHDVGMTRVSEELLSRIDPLTPDEILEIKRHPCLSYQMLKTYPAMPREGLRLVLEHHEDADGSGYPQSLPLVKQHPWTRIMRVVDTYDALTAYRPYRIAQTPFAALKFLQEQMGPRGPLFDLRTLKTFIRFLALPA